MRLPACSLPDAPPRCRPAAPRPTWRPLVPIACLAVLWMWVVVPVRSAAQEAEGAAAPYTFVLRGVALDEALEAFSQTTGVAVAYAPRLARGREAYCVARDAAAEAVLRCILRDSGLDFYRLSSGTYILTAPAEVEPARGALTGRVADRRTGAPLPNAHVQLADAGRGAVTGPAGRFTLAPLLPGTYVVQVSHVGYETWRDTLRVTPEARTRADAALRPEPVVVAPVVIDGLQSRRPNAALGRARLDAEAASVGWRAASTAPLRQLNTLPGVRVSDLTADVHVQGGRPGDHQMRLDGAPVYLPRTLAGLIGPFGAFAIDRITVEKAGFGAAAGSQMAGVIDARHALGRTTRADLQADPLSLNGRLQLAPSVAGVDDVAVMAAGRLGLGALYEPARLNSTLATWSGLDPFLLAAAAPAAPASAVSQAARSATAASLPGPHHTDAHVAARVRLRPLHTLHASAYRGTRSLAGSAWAAPDDLAPSTAAARLVTTAEDYRWRNVVGQVRYDAVLGSHTLFRAHLQGSHYRFDHDYTGIDSLRLRAGTTPPQLVGSTRTPLQDANRLRTVRLQGSVDHTRGAHRVHLGAAVTHTASTFTLHGVRLAQSTNTVDEAPGRPLDVNGASARTPQIQHAADTWRLSAFARNRVALGAQWEAEAGVRLTYRPERATAYAEPRLAVRTDRSNSRIGTWSMRTAAGLYRQFTHQTDASVFNAGALLPSVRIWLPLDESVSPPRAYHVAHELLIQPTARWALRAEGFYKHQPRHLALRYAPPDQDALTGPLATQGHFLTATQGHALGGSLSATWSGPTLRLRALYEHNQTVRRSAALFGGRAHPAPETVPHRAEVGLDWTPTARWTLSLRGRGAWQRSWGFHRAYYDYFGHDADTRVQPPFDLGRPGAHRLPPLYQLDASLAYARELGPAALQVRLEVLNLTDRTNVADWRLRYADGRWTKTARPLYPRLPSLVLRVGL